MSYSIGVRAATKAEAKQAIGDKFDNEVLPSQPVHAIDRNAAVAAAQAFIDLLPDDETRDVVVSMNGSLSGEWQGSELVRLGGGGVSVSASLQPRGKAA